MLAFSRRFTSYVIGIAGRRPSRLTSEQLGLQAELLVARFFMRRGYSVLGQRERNETAEMDLLLVDHWKRHEEMIVVEIKASRMADALPHRRFTPAKKQRVLLAARLFRRQHHLIDSAVRLELVTVVWGMRGLWPAIRRFPLGTIDDPSI